MRELPLRTGFIYRVINRANGKSYVGQTVRSVKARWKQHLYAARKYSKLSLLHSAIRKYGIESFSVETILECEIVYLNCFEKLFIQINKSLYSQHGYNITPGGEGLGVGEMSPNFGRKYSAEHRGRISQAKRGIKFSDEHKANLSKAHGKHNARKWSEESKKKLSRTRTGMKFSDSHRANISKAGKARGSK